MHYNTNIKAISRDFVCHFLWKIGLTIPSKYAKRKLTVITFHRVLTEAQRLEYPLPNLAVTPQELDWLLVELKVHFECGPFTKIYKRWLNNEETDKPFLAITFDDGQYDNYCNAIPVLNKHQLKATFYIPVDFINTQQNIWHDRLGFSIQECQKSDSKTNKLTKLIFKYFGTINNEDISIKNISGLSKTLTPKERHLFVEDIEAIADTSIPEWAKMMTWTQIIELNNAGHEIGSHTITHALLPQLNSDELHFEIFESLKILEKQLKSEVNSFCYPNGDSSPTVESIVAEAGYNNAVTTKWGINEKSTGNFEIKRFDIDAFQLVDRHNNLSNKRLHMRFSGIQPGLR